MGSACHRATRYSLVGFKKLFVISFEFRIIVSFFLLSNSEGGFFKAHLSFPVDYPLRPPKMKFISEIWHSNSMCSYLKSSELNKIEFIDFILF